MSSSPVQYKPLVPSELNPPLNYTLITDIEGLEKLRDYLQRVREFAIDFETNIVDFFMDRKARTVQIGDKNEQYVVDLLGLCGWSTERLIKAQGYFYGQAPELVSMLEPLDPALQALIDVIKVPLESGEWLKIGQNLGFEYIMLWWGFGIRMWNCYGIDLAEKVLLAGIVPPFVSGHFAMDDMVRKYMWLEIDKTLQKGFDLENPLTQDQVVYCALDDRLPMGVRQAQLPKLEKEGLRYTAEFIEMNAIGAFEDMHMWGFYLNRDAWLDLFKKTQLKHKENIVKLDEYFIPLVGRKGLPDVDLDGLEEAWRDTPNKTAEEKALRAARRAAFMAARKSVTEARNNMDAYEGEAAINYASPEQLLTALRKIKGLNKTTLPDTNDDTLKKSATDFPILEALRDYRTTGKKLSTYGEEWTKWINPATGRVHSRFNQIGTDTGRPSSNKPNLYNLPKEPEVRACWQVQPPQREGQSKTKIIKIDMSGAELRILAEMANSKSWLEAFSKDWDIHCVCTELMYPEKWPTIGLADCAYFNADHKKCTCPAHNELRDGTKASNFLVVNGGGPRKLSIDLGTTYDKAMEILQKHQQNNAEVWVFLDKSGQHAKLHMESVRSLSGRRRKFVRPTWDMAVEKTHQDWKKEKKSGSPTHKDFNKKLAGLFGYVERQGKNYGLQSSNADIAKIAMGSGHDPDGKPFLWHRLWPEFRARMVNFVYDEFVVECPEENVAACVIALADAIKRAGAMLLKQIEMKSENKVAEVWTK